MELVSIVQQSCDYAVPYLKPLVVIRFLDTVGEAFQAHLIKRRPYSGLPPGLMCEDHATYNNNILGNDDASTRPYTPMAASSMYRQPLSSVPEHFLPAHNPPPSPTRRQIQPAPASPPARRQAAPCSDPARADPYRPPNPS